jgi:hypothetical protein
MERIVSIVSLRHGGVVMSSIIRARARQWNRTILGGCLLLVVALSVAHSQPVPGIPGYPGTPIAPVKQAMEPGSVEVAFTDGSNLKMQLRDDKIVLATPHGKLLIAVGDIQRIEFATRVSEADDKRIRAAVADLGSSEFSKREAASADLLKLRHKAYPSLLAAAEQKDAEVARRAKELIQRIAATVPAEQLAVRKMDVIHTADSTISGRIEGVSLRAHTEQFGIVQVKLADVRGLRSQGEQTLAKTTRGTEADWRKRLMEAQMKMKEAAVMEAEANAMMMKEREQRRLAK